MIDETKSETEEQMDKTILSLEKNSVYELYFINFRNMNFDSLDDPLVSYNNIGTRIDIKKNNFVL